MSYLYHPFRDSGDNMSKRVKKNSAADEEKYHRIQFSEYDIAVRFINT